MAQLFCNVISLTIGGVEVNTVFDVILYYLLLYFYYYLLLYFYYYYYIILHYFQTVMNVGINASNMTRFAALTLSQAIRIFILCLPGQRLLNHSEEVYAAA